MSNPIAAKCGKCNDEAEVAFVCGGCFKPVCVECALDDEKERRRCWMCMDWAGGGHAAPQKGRRHAA